MATKTVTFESRYSAYALVRYPKVETPSPTGIGYQLMHRGKTYQFQPVPSPKAESGFIGVLTLKVGQDKMDTDHEGWLRPEFEQGVTRDAIEALKAHKEFGSDFWEQGFGPGTLYPRDVDFRRDITVATAALDTGRLEAMIAEETASHGRVDLLEAARDALAVVQETRAEIEAEQAKIEIEAEPAPKAKAKPKAPAAA
jgi:hypothetical protein